MIDEQKYIDETLETLDQMARTDHWHVDSVTRFKPVEVLHLAREREIADALNGINGQAERHRQKFEAAANDND